MAGEYLRRPSQYRAVRRAILSPALKPNRSGTITSCGDLKPWGCTMDVTNMAISASVLSQQKVGDAVGITVQKKAMDIQAQNAASLIESVPKAGGANPPNLGKNIDVRA